MCGPRICVPGSGPPPPSRRLREVKCGCIPAAVTFLTTWPKLRGARLYKMARGSNLAAARAASTGKRKKGRGRRISKAQKAAEEAAEETAEEAEGRAGRGRVVYGWR